MEYAPKGTVAELIKVVQPLLLLPQPPHSLL
jgi:hypothetical protein